MVWLAKSKDQYWIELKKKNWNKFKRSRLKLGYFKLFSNNLKMIHLRLETSLNIHTVSKVFVHADTMKNYAC